jgi:hypothetical protein
MDGCIEIGNYPLAFLINPPHLDLDIYVGIQFTGGR